MRRSVAILLLAACARGPGRTPVQTVENLERALQAGDFGSVHRMLARPALRELESAFELAKAGSVFVPEEEKRRWGLESLETIDAREWFVRTGRAVHETNRAYFRELDLEPRDVQRRQDAAVVQLRVRTAGTNRTLPFPLTLEDGLWKIGDLARLREAMPRFAWGG